MSDTSSISRARRAALAGGCTFRAVRHGGDLSYRFECPNHRSKLRVLDELATIDACDPWVASRARAIAADALGDRLQTLLAAHRYVRDGVEFIEEPCETFQAARLTLSSQVGDCDCSALALAALLRSLGYVVRFGTLASPPTHVAVQVLWEGRWEWLETTMKAEPGEHPLAARERLGADDRPDLRGPAGLAKARARR